MMRSQFQVSGGSVSGSDHRRIGKNNQDSYGVFSSDDLTVAVVCDGCGSGLYSEFGSKLGTRLVIRAIASCWKTELNDAFWQEVNSKLIQQLREIALYFDHETHLLTTINDYFLFTIVGVVITPSETVTFAIGDGIIAVNDQIVVIDQFPDNAPPYLAYQLIKPNPDYNFKIYHRLPTDTVNSILIGTDGVKDLIENQANNLPGKTEIVGNLSQFWQEDRYFKNSDMIRRRLSLINQETTKPDWNNHTLNKISGLLSDDTTLIAIRRIAREND